MPTPILGAILAALHRSLRQPKGEWISREDYDAMVEYFMAEDRDARGPAIDHDGRSRREYVESWLRPQYRIEGEDE
jgi:hypothetical protein